MVTMRLFVFALVFVAAFAFAADMELGLRHITGPTGGGSDADVYSQTYDFGILQNGYSNYGAGSRWVCDDFELAGDYDVREIYVWMIWTGEQGTMMNFIISEDDAADSDPNTNTDVWSEGVPCTNTFTGDSNWGYDIYETYCTVNADAYPELYAGTHYYFETQADVVDNCFILISPNYIGDFCWFDDGSGVYVRSDVAFGQDSDMFFDFFGEPLALESGTWGTIKTLF